MFTLYSDSGNSWRVKVKVQQGSYFFNTGWSKFVKYHGLEKGIFWFSFWLIVQCLMFSFIIEQHVQRTSFWLLRNQRVDPLELADRMNKPQTRNQEQFLYIPRCFVKETGMGKESITVIKDPRGGMLPMKTTVSREQVRFGCGWFQFLHGNEIAAGDTLLFEHFPNTGNFIHVQVINKGGNGYCGRLNKQANPCEDTSLAAKRPRGRPRKQIEEPPSTKYAPSTAF
ncbi:hypothetical protein Golob_022567 [Gossypium lobatum]|uniref:TF-B3 domain-containing protein n=1 Tax=Gossypium lobatum TaxID=34289 RepID=A0A7J8LGZ6_9ROSI|nr:hypothetical protein [Gossypium lobatum]